MKYLIVIEETSTGYSAFSPDLDGCVATGSTKKETEVNIKEAIEFHLEGLRIEGFEMPSPHSYSRYLEIPAYRDGNASHETSLPHHRTNGSVFGGSADQAESDPRENKPK